MDKTLQNKIDVLSEEYEEIFSDLNDLSTDILQKNGSGWSIIQVLSHLEMAESGSVRYMQKKMQAGEKMKKIGAINNFRFALTRGLLQSSLKWKAPKVISSPPNDQTLRSMKEKWDKTRFNTIKYASRYPETLLDRLVYKHPFAGRLSLAQAIESFTLHQRHHKHQILRIRKELGV